MLPNQPGFQTIKLLPTATKGKKILLQRPVGKNPFLQTDIKPFQQKVQNNQQPNNLQSQLAEVIYNKITAQQPSILSKDTLVVQEGSILDQIIRRYKKEKPQERKSLQQQQELAQSNLDSSRAILDAYQPRGTTIKQQQKQTQPPVIARTRKPQQLTTSPKIQKYNQQRIQKPNKHVNDISDGEDSIENIASIPIQTAISGYNQETTNTIQQSANQLTQIAKNPQSDVQLMQIEQVIKNLSTVVKSRPQSSGKNKQNVPILQATQQQQRPPIYEQMYKPSDFLDQPGNLMYDDMNNLNNHDLDMADGDGSGLWRGDLQGIIEKPPEEAALENPDIQLGRDAGMEPEIVPEFSFNDQSYNTMNVRKSQQKPEANEFTVKKTQHKPIEITAERDSFSSGLQSVQAINQIDQQAQKLLEAQENQPEVQLPICDIQQQDNQIDFFDKSATPDGQSMTTPKVSKEDIVNVVKEVLPELLGQFKTQNADKDQLNDLEQQIEEKINEKLRSKQKDAEISPLPRNDYNLSKSNAGGDKQLFLDNSEFIKQQEQLKHDQEEKLRELEEKKNELQEQEAERLKALEKQNEKEKQLSQKEAELQAREEELNRISELLQKQLEEKQNKAENITAEEPIVKKEEIEQDKQHPQQQVEYVQLDVASEKDSESEPSEEIYEHARFKDDLEEQENQKYEDTPQPNNPALRDIPINELSNDELLNNDYFDEEPIDRPLNRSGHRSQSHSIQDQTSLPPEALEAAIGGITQELEEKDEIPANEETVEIIPVAPANECTYSSVTDLQSSPERKPDLLIDDQSEPKVVQVVPDHQEQQAEQDLFQEVPENVESKPQQSPQYEMVNSGPEVQLDAMEVEELDGDAKNNENEKKEDTQEDTKPDEVQSNDFSDLEEPNEQQEETKQLEEQKEEIPEPVESEVKQIEQQPKDVQPVPENSQEQIIKLPPEQHTKARVLKSENKTIPDSKQCINTNGEMFYVPDILCTRQHYNDFVEQFIQFLEGPLNYEDPLDHLLTKQNVQIADFILDQLEILHNIRLKSKPGKQILHTSNDILTQNELGDLINIEIENSNMPTLKKIIPELFSNMSKKLCIEEASRQPIKSLEQMLQPTDDELLAQCLDGVDALLDEIIDEVADTIMSQKVPDLG